MCNLIEKFILLAEILIWQGLQKKSRFYHTEKNFIHIGVVTLQDHRR